MKKIYSILFALFINLVTQNLVQASSRTFGLGMVLGEPTGINAKLWLQQEHALNFVLAWGWGYNRYGRNNYYEDTKCYESGFYRKNFFYCDSRYYQGNDRYNPRGFHIRSDYLIHNFNVIKSSERIPLYYGPGVSMESYRDDIQFGIRGNLGVVWMHQSLPFDIFVEIAPVLQIFPGLFGDFTGGIGSRFYF